jgi:hypothetical protein
MRAPHSGKVCTVNTVYFWKSLETGFTEIRRVLARGGRVVIGFLPKDGMARLNMPADIFTLRAPEDVIAALKKLWLRRHPGGTATAGHALECDRRELQKK